MNPPELQPHQLMQRVADFCQAQSIPYRVVGSMASMAYSEPRLTNDIDIVADLQLKDIPVLSAAFPAPEYYLSEEAAREAVRQRGQFNVIHPASGLRVDLFVPIHTDYARLEAERIRHATGAGEYSA